MWRTIKKWWILQLLEREIDRHSLKMEDPKQLVAGAVLLSKEFFILGNEAHEGIVYRSYLTMIYPGWDIRLISPTEESLRKRTRDFKAIYDELLADGLITSTETTRGSMDYPTAKGTEIHGLFGLAEFILARYGKIVAALLGGGAVGIIWVIKEISG